LYLLIIRIIADKSDELSPTNQTNYRRQIRRIIAVAKLRGGKPLESEIATTIAPFT
ncbi:hypothetical protein SK128_017341, partial [Halocaridina rubra]